MTPALRADPIPVVGLFGPKFLDGMKTNKAPAEKEGKPSANDTPDGRSSSQSFLESGRNFRALIENASDGIALVNAQGTMIFASPSARRMFGYPPDFPLESLDNDAATHPEDLPAVLEMLRDLMQHPGRVQTIEYRFRHHDGGWRWIESCFSNLLDVPGVEAVVINFRNIEERKLAGASLAAANRKLTHLLRRAEDLAVQAEAATRAKSEFLMVVSHELRTPLNAVLGFSEMLAETSLSEEQKGFADTILKSGARLLDLVDDILDFSSIERGGMTVEPSGIVLAGLLEPACVAIRKSAADKGLEFRCEIAPGVPKQIISDGRRIRKILAHLLGNAVKFTSDGTVILRIADSSDGRRRALDFSVEDTGSGIPAETLEALFQPFTQADSTLRRAFGGAGLGLAISRRLAEAMGGRLTAISMPGRGSTFTLHLPIDGDPGSTGAFWSAENI